MIARCHSRPPVAVTRSGRAFAVALAAALVFGAALAAGSVSAGRYKGTTSEGGPVTLTISANRRTITHFSTTIGYNGKCGPGGGPGLTAAPATIAIGARGSFTKNVSLTLTSIANPIRDPGRVFGRVSGSKITGTVEQFLHGQVNKCYVETFTAHRK